MVHNMVNLSICLLVGLLVILYWMGHTVTFLMDVMMNLSLKMNFSSGGCLFGYSGNSTNNRTQCIWRKPLDPCVIPQQSTFLKTANDFVAYFTPIILIVGLIGNSLSLAVFTSKTMRKLSASTYLAALSAADICSLVFYVLIDWLRRGLVHINPDLKVAFLDKDGFCQVSLFFAYVSRLMSSWIIVIFTIERFTGVCYPLKSFKRGPRNVILKLLVACCLLVIYRPILTRERTVRCITACDSHPDHQLLVFMLDTVFAVSITLVPFIIITVLNFLIVRTLFLRNMRNDLFSDDTRIRLEFTFILLAISFFFIAFNLPYIAVWPHNFIRAWSVKVDHGEIMTDYEYWQALLKITRTIFFMNYCVNFFLYSITGAYFRSALKDLLTFRRKRNSYRSYIRCSRLGSTHTQVTAGGSMYATYSA